MDIRAKILEAAARLYAEAGFRGTTTRRIAIEAGVNEVTLFRHFGSKGALLCEAMKLAARDGLAHAAATLPDEPGDPLAEITEWARAHIADLRRKRSLIRTGLGEIEEHPELFQPCGSPPAQSTQLLASYLARLQERGLAHSDFDPRVAAAMLGGTLFADAMGRDIMPDLFDNDPDDAVRQYARLLYSAIGGDRG